MEEFEKLVAESFRGDLMPVNGGVADATGVPDDTAETSPAEDSAEDFGEKEGSQERSESEQEVTHETGHREDSY